MNSKKTLIAYQTIFKAKFYEKLPKSILSFRQFKAFFAILSSDIYPQPFAAYSADMAVYYLNINKENSGYASSAIVIISVRVFSRSSGVMSSVPVRGLFVTVQMHSAFLPAAAAFI